MLHGADKIDPWERQLLLVFKQAAENSPWLNQTQKLAIETRIQEIVDIWTKKEEPR